MKYKLGEICEIVSGSTPKTSVPEYWDGDVKWITPAEISDDSYIIEDSVRHITELGVQKTGLSSFPKGTVILSSRAPIGKVAIAGCEMYCNQGFKNLICSDVIDNRYLYWFLKGNTEYLNSLGRGATFKEISKQIVSSIEITVPDHEEQMTAVEALEKVARVIRLRKQQLAVLDALIKARFVEMFVGKNYPLVSVDDLSLGKGEYGAQSASIDYDASRPRYVRITDINDDGTLNDDLVSSSNVGDDQQYKLSYGDFLFARMGATVGKTYAYKNGNLIYAGYLIRYKLNLDKVMPEYLYAYTRLEKYWNWVKLNQSGAAQPGINAKKYGSLQIPVPPLSEQKAFQSFVVQVDKSKAVVQKALDKAQVLFDSLMQQYFG